MGSILTLQREFIIMVDILLLLAGLGATVIVMRPWALD
jgi:hypothetical protein